MLHHKYIIQTKGMGWNPVTLHKIRKKMYVRMYVYCTICQIHS